jgi:hypothetical protein
MQFAREEVLLPANCNLVIPGLHWPPMAVKIATPSIQYPLTLLTRKEASWVH